jgi:hypothetical protein
MDGCMYGWTDGRTDRCEVDVQCRKPHEQLSVRDAFSSRVAQIVRLLVHGPLMVRQKNVSSGHRLSSRQASP